MSPCSGCSSCHALGLGRRSEGDDRETHEPRAVRRRISCLVFGYSAADHASASVRRPRSRQRRSALHEHQRIHMPALRLADRCRRRAKWQDGPGETNLGARSLGVELARAPSRSSGCPRSRSVGLRGDRRRRPSARRRLEGMSDRTLATGRRSRPGACHALRVLVRLVLPALLGDRRQPILPASPVLGAAVDSRGGEGPPRLDRAARARGRARPRLGRGRSRPRDHRDRRPHRQGRRAGAAVREAEGIRASAADQPVRHRAADVPRLRRRAARRRRAAGSPTYSRCSRRRG